MVFWEAFSLCFCNKLFLRLSGLYHRSVLEKVKAKVPCAVLISSSLAGEQWLFDLVAWYWCCGLSLQLFIRIFMTFNVFIIVSLLSGGKSIRIWLILIWYRETNLKIRIPSWFRWSNSDVNVLYLVIQALVLGNMLTEFCVSGSVALIVLRSPLQLLLA